MAQWLERFAVQACELAFRSPGARSVLGGGANTCIIPASEGEGGSPGQAGQQTSQTGKLWV